MRTLEQEAQMLLRNLRVAIQREEKHRQVLRRRTAVSYAE